MSALKPWQWAALALGLCLALFLIYFHLQFFGDISFLGGILLIEIIIAALWNYKERFLLLLIVTFLWAGMNVPFQGAGTMGRWVVLGSGAAVGFIVWTKTPQNHFRTIHLLAFFCVCSAFVSATVSSFFQMAALKAASLLLLFLYCSSGARMAVLGREERFFNGVLLGAEVITFGTALCSFGLNSGLWGNPNSLGAAMSIGPFPILLWGWLTSEGTIRKTRRLVALLLCTYLVQMSMARAGMVAVILVTVVFCCCLHQYRLLIKVAGLVLALIAVGGMLAPDSLNQQLSDLKDAFLYKGHKEEGLLGSRLTPWETSINSIKEHPLFGTGYGTSPTGENPGLGPGKFSSSAEEEREHGSSYITIAEWVGVLGVVPFALLLGLTVSNVWKVCVWMRRTADPKHYSIPLAMVVLGGLIHAAFEDSLFAVGSYLSLWFWVVAFILADLVPETAASPVSSAASGFPRPLPAGFGAAVSNR